MASPTLDSSGIVVNGGWLDGSANTITFSTTTANGLAVLLLYFSSDGNAQVSITGVTSAHLTWTKQVDYEPGLTNKGTIQVWTAPITGTLTNEVVTVTHSGTMNAGVMVATGVNGCFSNASPFDPNGSLPAENTATGNVTVTFSTTKPDDLLFFLTGGDTATSTSGAITSWTRQTNTDNGLGPSEFCCFNLFTQAVSAAQMGTTVTTTGVNGASHQLGVVIAFTGDGPTTAKVTKLGATVWSAGASFADVTKLGATIWTVTASTIRITQLFATVWVPIYPTLPRATATATARAVDASYLRNNVLRVTAVAQARAVVAAIVDLCPPKVNPPVTIQEIIPSYLYQEYSDDDDLQGFVAAQNTLQQEYLDSFNTLNLPYYPGVIGQLLDWVIEGLYGLTRPTLPFGVFRPFGTFGTATYNRFYYNEFDPDQPLIGTQAGFSAVSDDVFQRILTWHFYKGDGKYFSIPWLKRRVMRFLVGANGLQPDCPPFAEHYRVTVAIVGQTVYIGFLTHIGFFDSGTRYNDKTFRYNRLAYNSAKTHSISFPALPLTKTFKAAMDAGVLEFPFQFIPVVFAE